MLEAITTPLHIKDEGTGDIDRSNLNEYCILTRVTFISE